MTPMQAAPFTCNHIVFNGVGISKRDAIWVSEGFWRGARERERQVMADRAEYVLEKLLPSEEDLLKKALFTEVRLSYVSGASF